MSDTTSETKAPPCAALRFKGHYVHLDGPPDPAEADTAVYWCLRTQQPIGPDSDSVGPWACKPGRSCFEAPVEE